jgi:hypothetical protein
VFVEDRESTKNQPLALSSNLQMYLIN